MADVLELVDWMLRPDPHGRLTGSQPHLYVFRSSDAVLCRCHADLSDAAVQALERIALAPRGRQRDWPSDYGQYLTILAEVVGPVRAVRSGPLYQISDPPESTATRITSANASLLSGGLDEWLPDVDAGRLIYAVIDGGHAVSLCASVNAVEGAHEAGVETLPSHRRKGLAAHAVAAWAGEVLRMNATPFYGTTFDNLASQGVARRLSMDLVGSEFSVQCTTPAEPPHAGA